MSKGKRSNNYRIVLIKEVPDTTDIGLGIPIPTHSMDILHKEEFYKPNITSAKKYATHIVKRFDMLLAKCFKKWQNNVRISGKQVYEKRYIRQCNGHRYIMRLIPI